MDQNGGDNSNNLNDSNFLSIDHSSPIEQPVDPVKDVNPVDIYSPETNFDSPNIAPSVSESVATELATADNEQNTQATEAQAAAPAAEVGSNIQTTQATAYDYSNAFGIAATDDTNTIKNVGSATGMTEFEGTGETPQFFSEAMENAITSGKPAKKERKSRTARKTTPTPAPSVSMVAPATSSMGAPIMLNTAQPERRGGKAKLFIIVAIVLALIGGGIALAFHLTDSGVIYDHNGLAKQLRELGNLVIYGEEKEDELPEFSSVNKGTGLNGLFNEYGELDREKIRVVEEKYSKIAIVGSEEVKDSLKRIGTQIDLLSYYANTYESTSTESLIALYNLGGRESALKDIENIFKQDSNGGFSQSSYAEMAREYASIRLSDIANYDAAGCIVDKRIDLRCSATVRGQKPLEERQREADLGRAIEETIWDGGDKLVEQIIDVEGEVK